MFLAFYDEFQIYDHEYNNLFKGVSNFETGGAGTKYIELFKCFRKLTNIGVIALVFFLSSHLY